MKRIFCLAILIASTFASLSQGYVLSVNPTNPYPGELTTITFRAPSTANTWGDWFGLTKPENPYVVQNIWNISGGDRSGNRTFTYTTPGNYTVQWFDNKGFARTPPITFTIRTGPEAYSVSVSTNSTQVNRQIAVSWNIITNVQIEGDIIGYASASNPNVIIGSVGIDLQRTGTAYWIARPPGTYDFGIYKPNNSSYTLVSPLARISVSNVSFTIDTQRLGTNLVLRWPGQVGATYTVFSSTNLTTPRTSWSIIKTTSGTGSMLSVSNTTTGPRKFFSVRESW